MERDSYPWERIRVLCELLERHDRITPVVVRDAAACEMLAWWSLNQASMADLHDAVAAGRVLDETSHVRERIPDGLIGLKPDMIDFDRFVVVEKKASKGASAASRIQLAVYCALLANATGNPWNGELYFFSVNRREKLLLSEELIEDALGMARRCVEILALVTPPWRERHGLCDGCSARELCGF